MVVPSCSPPPPAPRAFFPSMTASLLQSHEPHPNCTGCSFRLPSGPQPALPPSSLVIHCAPAWGWAFRGELSWSLTPGAPCPDEWAQDSVNSKGVKANFVWSI